MRINKLKSFGIVLSLALLSACGGGGGGASVAPVTTTTAVQTDQTGTTTTANTITVEQAVVGIPAGTTLKDANGNPVTGNVVTTTTFGTSAAFLPANAQTAPTSTTMKAYLQINMNSLSAAVKTVNPAIPVVIFVPQVANGTPLDLYSHGEGANDTWVKEGTVTVENGAASFSVSHFTYYGLFQQSLTGLTGGSNGGTTAN